MVRNLKHWEHYMIRGKFVMVMDHQALEFIYNKNTINQMHVKYVVYIQLGDPYVLPNINEVSFADKETSNRPNYYQ